jgi:hypothetical protein
MTVEDVGLGAARRPREREGGDVTAAKDGLAFAGGIVGIAGLAPSYLELKILCVQLEPP